jgi:hypothetical protein
MVEHWLYQIFGIECKLNYNQNITYPYQWACDKQPARRHDLEILKRSAATMFPDWYLDNVRGKTRLVDEYVRMADFDKMPLVERITIHPQINEGVFFSDNRLINRLDDPGEMLSRYYNWTDAGNFIPGDLHCVWIGNENSNLYSLPIKVYSPGHIRGGWIRINALGKRPDLIAWVRSHNTVRIMYNAFATERITFNAVAYYTLQAFGGLEVDIQKYVPRGLITHGYGTTMPMRTINMIAPTGNERFQIGWKPKNEPAKQNE